MLNLVLIVTCLLFISSTQATNYTNDTYIYIDPDFQCSDEVNHTINYTCDGSYSHPFNTIQEGLNVAHGGTVMTLMDGIYSGVGNMNLEIYDGYRRIYSENGYSSTIIDCENNGFGIAFVKGTFLLRGITIRNCVGSVRSLVGIPFGYNGTVEASNTENTIGGALWIEQAYANITDCYLNGNSAQYGGGLYTYSSTVEFEASKIANNEATLGGGLYVYNAYLSLNHSTAVLSNTATDGGGGVYIKSSTVEVDYNSYLSFNEADNEEGNEVLCVSGAGTLLHYAYLTSITLDCDTSFEDGDAVCYADCTLTQKNGNFDYCGYEFDEDDCDDNDDSGDSDDNDDSDASGDDADDDDSDTSDSTDNSGSSTPVTSSGIIVTLGYIEVVTVVMSVLGVFMQMA